MVFACLVYTDASAIEDVKMEIFRNYISRNDKKLTMDDSWSKVCCRWANSLDLADVKDLMSLVDGE